MALLDDLKWRYATKKYDPTKKVAQADVDKIIESARLAPTSSGLQ
jgi:nitroreductase/dihydropteridine reductase